MNVGLTTTERVNPAPAEPVLATATEGVNADLTSIKLRRHAEGFYVTGGIPKLRVEEDDTRVDIERRQLVPGCYLPGEPGCNIDSELRVEWETDVNIQPRAVPADCTIQAEDVNGDCLPAWNVGGNDNLRRQAMASILSDGSGADPQQGQRRQAQTAPFVGGPKVSHPQLTSVAEDIGLSQAIRAREMPQLWQMSGGNPELREQMETLVNIEPREVDPNIPPAPDCLTLELNGDCALPTNKPRRQSWDSILSDGSSADPQQGQRRQANAPFVGGLWLQREQEGAHNTPPHQVDGPGIGVMREQDHARANIQRRQPSPGGPVPLPVTIWRFGKPN